MFINNLFDLAIGIIFHGMISVNKEKRRMRKKYGGVEMKGDTQEVVLRRKRL
jgi:hypothetical protein